MGLETPTAGGRCYAGSDTSPGRRASTARLRREIQMVFQDPYTSLNPRMTVGDIIGEPLEIHTDARPRGDRRAAGAANCSSWSG